MKILITGGAGFVGSSIGILLKQRYPHYQIFALDNLKRRGSELNLPRLKEAGIIFFHGDVRNPEDFNELPEINFIIEASAEPSVLAGINSTPDYLVNTNLSGTVNCLNFAVKKNANFIFLSTSRVYPINQIEKIIYEEKETRFNIKEKQNISGISLTGISEDFPLEGYRSIYGATKLCSEYLINEYQHFYNLKTVINRCGVLTGPWQMGKVDQGVVVLWMARHFWKQDLSYIGFNGSGKQVRDILHVNDLFELTDYQIHNIDKINGETYNVGGGKDVSVSLKELTHYCSEISGNTISINEVKENRTADISLYITDNSKVTAATGWEPKTGTKEILKNIYDWIKNNEQQLYPILK